MSEGNQQQHKEGLMDKILHHHHHQHHQETQPQQQASEQQSSDKSSTAQPERKKESELQKFEDYIKEDEKMEQEGGTYGGLM